LGKSQQSFRALPACIAIKPEGFEHFETTQPPSRQQHRLESGIGEAGVPPTATKSESEQEPNNRSDKKRRGLAFMSLPKSIHLLRLTKGVPNHQVGSSTSNTSKHPVNPIDLETGEAGKCTT
jgi:hypothetical protein